MYCGEWMRIVGPILDPETAAHQVHLGFGCILQTCGRAASEPAGATSEMWKRSHG
jgi:hypothetical protein